MNVYTEVRFCSFCGCSLKQEMSYCPQCGTKVATVDVDSAAGLNSQPVSEEVEYKYKKGEEVFPGYKVIKPLGSGGFGQVYKCKNESGFVYAAKIMYEAESVHLNSDKRKRLTETLTKIKSRRLVTVNDVGWNEDNRFVIIMECLEGATLDRIIPKIKKDEEKACKYFMELLEILDTLEKKGLVHRDIKPENIFIEDGYMKLGDHDLIRFTSGNSGGLTTKIGTLAYMCPERFNEDNEGRYGYDADRWSAFCVFFEILTGKRAFPGKSLSSILGSVAKCKYQKSFLPEKYHNFFDKEFSSDPKKRYESLKQIKEAFNNLTINKHDKHKTLFKEKFTNEFGMEFVWIKPGKFMMGSPISEKGRSDKEILHEVELTHGFYIMTTPVTQKIYEKLMGKNLSYFKDCPDNPVEQVSWIDAQKFIMKLNKKDKSFVYSLPTEAQWEYSCRAGSKTAFSWGNSPDCSRANFGVGLSQECSGINPGETSPVKSYPPNKWGLYDMHGNVWEWCLDWYGDYEKEPVTNPGGPGSGSNRVYRGGGWHDDARLCRSAYRCYFCPGLAGSLLGFRVVASQAGR